MSEYLLHQLLALAVGALILTCIELRPSVWLARLAKAKAATPHAPWSRRGFQPMVFALFFLFTFSWNFVAMAVVSLVLIGLGALL